MSSTASDTGSPASRVSDESLTSEDTNAGCMKSPLWRSLYVLAKSHLAVNDNTVSCVPTANNPRPVRAMGDNAEYWVNVSGEVFTFKFPATLDLEGQHDRSGPYFNLPRTGLDLTALKKMRAQFEVRPLDVNAGDVYPEEAIKCSSAAIDMLNVLHGEAEDARNALLPNPAMYPRDVPFWRRYAEAENERFSVVLTTDPLVHNIPDPSRSSVPRLKRSDIGKGDTMQSPSKAKAAAMAGGSPGGGEGSSTAANRDDLLSGLPDPLGRYAGLITQYNLHNAVVVPPAVRDGNGVVIKPSEYGSKLVHRSVVMVECLLKLWNIGPNRRETAHDDDKSGSRRYQVMLKSLKVLPDASITANTANDFMSDMKGKRKATDDGDGSQAKKKFVDYEDSEDGEEEDVSDTNNSHAMQVSDD